MKLLFFIDSLGSGGAQRQLVTLAVGLKKRGHEIRFLVYHQEDHFFSFLQDAGIPCQVIPTCSYVQRVLAIRRILRLGWQDVVLTFLVTPSFCAELACIPRKRWTLVVGERSANPKMNKGIGLWMRYFHLLADVVVCNSFTNQLMLETLFPLLRKKICTIYNTVDLALFRESSKISLYIGDNKPTEFRIVVAASYQELKNMINVAKALIILRDTHFNKSIVIDWFGGMPTNKSHFHAAKHFIAENKLETILRLKSATKDIASEYSRADAVGLFSFFEGLPNVICEGMACGKPILLSDVCDAGNLVKNGKNGFLCDPDSPVDIAEKIQRMADLSDFERQEMGFESRSMAEHLFNKEIILERYEQILMRAANHELLLPDCSWPKDVPESALCTVQRWA